MAKDFEILITASGDPGDPQDSSPSGERLGRFEASLETAAFSPIVANSAAYGHFGRQLRHPDAPMSLEQYKSGVAGAVPGDKRMFAVRGYKNRNAAMIAVQSLPGTMNEDDERRNRLRLWRETARGLPLGPDQDLATPQGVGRHEVGDQYHSIGAARNGFRMAREQARVKRLFALSLGDAAIGYKRDTTFDDLAALRADSFTGGKDFLKEPKHADVADAVESLARKASLGAQYRKSSFAVRTAEYISVKTGIHGLSRLAADSLYSKPMFAVLLGQQLMSRAANKAVQGAETRASVYANAVNSVVGDPQQLAALAASEGGVSRIVASASKGVGTLAVAGGVMAYVGGIREGLSPSMLKTNVARGIKVGAGIGLAVGAGIGIVQEIVHRRRVEKGLEISAASLVGVEKWTPAMITADMFQQDQPFATAGKNDVLALTGQARLALGLGPSVQTFRIGDKNIDGPDAIYTYYMAESISKRGLAGFAAGVSVPQKFGTGSYGDGKAKIQSLFMQEVDAQTRSVMSEMTRLDSTKIRSWSGR